MNSFLFLGGGGGATSASRKINLLIFFFLLKVFFIAVLSWNITKIYLSSKGKQKWIYFYIVEEGILREDTKEKRKNSGIEPLTIPCRISKYMHSGYTPWTPFLHQRKKLTKQYEPLSWSRGGGEVPVPLWFVHKKNLFFCVPSQFTYRYVENHKLDVVFLAQQYLKHCL